MAILLIYRSLPFSGLILFFGLQWYAGKPEVSRNRRSWNRHGLVPLLFSLLSIEGEMSFSTS